VKIARALSVGEEKDPHRTSARYPVISGVLGRACRGY